jgi:ACS family glucarate transporter-like MFS transporter
MNWRQAFAALSVLGVLWVVSLHSWLRKRDDSLPVAASRPAGHKPWRLLARSKTVWLLCAQYLALVFPWFFLITWAPTFIDERFHVSPAQSTALKVLPLLFGGLGALTSGFISAPVTRWTGSTRAARRTIGCLGFAGASGGLALTASLHAPLAAVLAVALSSFCNDLAMPVAWGTAAEVGGDWSATVSATMNMVGNVGGALYGLTAGLVLQATHHHWDVVLYMGAAVYSLGVPIWLAIDPVSRIDR